MLLCMWSLMGQNLVKEKAKFYLKCIFNYGEVKNTILMNRQRIKKNLLKLAYSMNQRNVSNNNQLLILIF